MIKLTGGHLISIFKQFFSSFFLSGLFKRSSYLLIACFLSSASLVYAEESDRHAIPSELAIHSLLTDASQVGDLMVVVGERGHILSSRDQGHSWQQGHVPTRELLTSVFMLNEQLGWAVGHDAVILRTRDGGHNWELQNRAIDDDAPLLDVWFQDDKHGLAVGAYGLLLVTSDGGDSWQQQWLNDEDDFHLNKLITTSSGAWLISAEAGMLYRSLDQGVSWQTLDSPYHGSFYGGLDLGQQRQWVFGLRGHLFITHDDGESWQTVESNTHALLTFALKTQTGDCLVAGHAGVLLINQGCDGENLELRQLEGRQAISALLESDEGILGVGEHGIERLKPRSICWKNWSSAIVAV